MGASSLQVTGINHVVLYTTDMQRSIDFYMGVLGFENRREAVDPDRNFLGCGIQGLDIFTGSGDIHPGQEMDHMALCVAGDDLDQIVDDLSKAGLQGERTPRNTVFIADPDGHRIEILPLSARPRSREREAAAAR